MSTDSPPNIDGLRLYRVELTQEIWVLAEDAFTAELDAPRHARHDMGAPHVYATEIEDIASGADTLDTLPHWDRDGDPPTIGEALAMIGERT